MRPLIALTLTTLTLPAIAAITNCRNYLESHGVSAEETSLILSCSRAVGNDYQYRDNHVKGGTVCLYSARDKKSWLMLAEVRVVPESRSIPDQLDGKSSLPIYTSNSEKVGLILGANQVPDRQSLYGLVWSHSSHPEILEGMERESAPSNQPDKFSLWKDEAGGGVSIVGQKRMKYHGEISNWGGYETEGDLEKTSYELRVSNVGGKWSTRFDTGTYHSYGSMGCNREK